VEREELGMDKLVKQEYEIKTKYPITKALLFLGGSGNPSDEHRILGFALYDSTGEIVWAIGLSEAQADAATRPLKGGDPSVN